MSVITFHGATLGICEWDLAATEVVVHNGVPLFLTAAGVEGFDPAADAPAAYVETGALSLAPGAVFNVPSAGALMQCDNRATLLVRAEGAGASSTASYRLPPRRVTTVEQQRTVQLGRGPRGTEWTLRLSSGGGPFSLSGLSVDVDRVRPQR